MVKCSIIRTKKKYNYYPALIHLSYPCCFRQGAVELEEEERKRQQERSAAFQGSGFRLGDSEGPSSVVAGTQRTTAKPVEKVASLSLSLLHIGEISFVLFFFMLLGPPYSNILERWFFD